MAIRTKLAIWFSILVAVVLTFSAIVRYTGYRQVLQSQKDYSLKVIADILDSSIPRRIPSRYEVQTAVSRMYKEYPDIELKGVLIEVYDPLRSVIFFSSVTEAQKLYITDDMWDQVIHKRKSITTLTHKEDDEHTSMRILTKPVFHKNKLMYIIQVASSTYDIEDTLDNILFLNILFIPFTTLLIAFGGWFLTKKALKPLNYVIAASHQISSGDLQHRITTSDTSSEITALTGAFNNMIARLESSFHQIKDFSANVSHELRIPLSILRGQTELSLKRYRSMEEYRKTLESNLEEILRMENIVERLLFVSRAERGELEVHKSELDIKNLLEWTREQFQLKAEEKNIILVSDTKGPGLVYGDEILLRELLLNLVKNAITYTKDGGSVTLGMEQNNKDIIIYVSDNGIGIPEEDIPHIFERFYQVDKSRAAQGSGLGLSICKWIVESHHGKILVESTVGAGTKFTVHLPIED